MLPEDAGHPPVGGATAAHAEHDGHGAAAHATHPAHAAQQAHPQPRTYITIALILAVITAIEVAVYYVPALLAFIVPILVVLSVAKFVLVVGYFMHLKFDHKLYTGLFAGGLAIALATFIGLFVLFLGHPGPSGAGGGPSSGMGTGH